MKSTKAHFLAQSIAWFSYVLLYTPIVVVVVWSLNATRHGNTWGGLTLDWYRALFRNGPAMEAIQNSLTLAILSTLVSTVLGTALGIGLGRGAFPGRRGILATLQLPVAVPDIVMAIALLLFAQWMRKSMGLLELGMTTMVLAHVTFQIPFVALVVRARREGLDPALEEAARDLGASPTRVFTRITFPLLWPGILGGALLAFALSLDDVVISFFTSGPGSTTLPILIHASVRRGLTPEIHALSSLLVISAVVLTLLASRFRQEGQSIH